MARTKQTTRETTGAKAPRRPLQIERYKKSATDLSGSAVSPSSGPQTVEDADSVQDLSITEPDETPERQSSPRVLLPPPSSIQAAVPKMLKNHLTTPAERARQNQKAADKFARLAEASRASDRSAPIMTPDTGETPTSPVRPTCSPLTPRISTSTMASSASLVSSLVDKTAATIGGAVQTEGDPARKHGIQDLDESDRDASDTTPSKRQKLLPQLSSMSRLQKSHESSVLHGLGARDSDLRTLLARAQRIHPQFPIGVQLSHRSAAAYADFETLAEYEAYLFSENFRPHYIRLRDAVDQAKRSNEAWKSYRLITVIDYMVNGTSSDVPALDDYARFLTSTTSAIMGLTTNNRNGPFAGRINDPENINKIWQIARHLFKLKSNLSTVFRLQRSKPTAEPLPIYTRDVVEEEKTERLRRSVQRGASNGNKTPPPHDDRHRLSVVGDEDKEGEDEDGKTSVSAATDGAKEMQSVQSSSEHSGPLGDQISLPRVIATSSLSNTKRTSTATQSINSNQSITEQPAASSGTAHMPKETKQSMMGSAVLLLKEHARRKEEMQDVDNETVKASKTHKEDPDRMQDQEQDKALDNSTTMEHKSDKEGVTEPVSGQAEPRMHEIQRTQAEVTTNGTATISALEPAQSPNAERKDTMKHAADPNKLSTDNTEVVDAAAFEFRWMKWDEDTNFDVDSEEEPADSVHLFSRISLEAGLEPLRARISVTFELIKYGRILENLWIYSDRQSVKPKPVKVTETRWTKVMEILRKSKPEDLEWRFWTKAA